MKLVAAIFMLIGLSTAVNSQDISGQWSGLLTLPGEQLRLVLAITKTDNGYTSTMDSPDQGANGIPVTTTTFAPPTLTINVTDLKIDYTGEVKGDSIVGTFRQNGYTFPLNLSKGTLPGKKNTRPQEPEKPYPYYSEDVTFSNPTAKISLAGTLTLPKQEGTFPAVILISGSGPQNRDEELRGHKPFLVLSDYLTRNGIAVLRYDDRGTGMSTGDFKTATSLEFASDAEAALAYLTTRKEIDHNKMGLIGHSEGGLIAPLVASKSTDVHFIVLLAGPGIPGYQLLPLQKGLIMRASGMSDAIVQKTQVIDQKAYSIVANSTNIDSLKQSLKAYLKSIDPGTDNSDKIAQQVSLLTNPWMRFFLSYDPAPVLEKVKCPVLALNGAKDLQVPPDVNLAAIRKALEKGGNNDVTTNELPGLNHLFQECETGSPNEYATIEQTFSPAALVYVKDWIVKHTK